MRLTRGENGTSSVAPVDLRDAVPTSENLSDLPTVEDTIDVAREDAEANVPLAVPSPKEPGAAERVRHEFTHMPYRSWCFSCGAGRGADDAHRKSDGYTGPPRVECDFMFLSFLLDCLRFFRRIHHGKSPSNCSNFCLPPPFPVSLSSL